MPATFATLTALDARLQRAGHHPLTQWWSEQLERFYGHPTARVLIARVGRGGAKSHTSVKVGLNELLNGDWLVPPGDVHYWCQVSENKTEAAERFRLCESALTALGIDYSKSGDAIIVPSLRRGVRVLACQIGAVSGFRCFGSSDDEVAKWDNGGEDPGYEVYASIDAMTITYPGARSFIVSSPWGTDDLHYDLFEKGDNEFQVTAYAPTWVANPSVTREQCVAKAKGNQKVFDREYNALAGLTIDAGLEPVDVNACIRGPHDFTPEKPAEVLQRMAGQYRVCDGGNVIFKGKFEPPGTILDLTEESARSLGSAVEHASRPPQEEIKKKRQPSIFVDTIEGFEEPDLRRLEAQNPDKKLMQIVVDTIAARCQAEGITHIFSDQYQASTLEAMFAAHSLGFKSFDWPEPAKEAAFDTLRRLLRERDISLLDHAILKKEMLGVKAHLRPNGRTGYPTNGLDYLSAVVTLAFALNADDLPYAGGFCCLDPSGLRGDAFTYLIGRRGVGKTSTMSDLLTLTANTIDSRWNGWNRRGF